MTDPAGGQPLAGVTVQVQGTALRGVTNAQGAYRIANVPAGRQTVTATAIGRAATTQSVTVAAGQTVTANLSLAAEAIGLEALVVTATGEAQRRREIGNAVSRVNLENVPIAATPSLANVLNGRSAGVTVVQSGGTTGTGARIRIRGSNSVSLSNEPLLIIDGVRVDNTPNSNSVGVGGQSPSRLNDINPQDIENIEILKGPAASALYGTAAANGVIQITTKRGRAGRPRWNAYTEQGTLNEPTEYPANYAGVGRTRAGGRTTFCTLDLQSRGLCTPVADSAVVSFNPLETVSPFRNGSRQKYGLNVSGGSENVTYYLSGDFEDENGVYEVNELERYNLRANLGAQITPELNVNVSTGYVASDILLPINDNSILGIISGGLLGSAFDNPRSRGYILQPPQELYSIENGQDVDRFTTGINANWRPFDWLSVTGTGGLDVLHRLDFRTVPPQSIRFSDFPEGQRTSNRVETGNYNTSLSATANFSLSEDVSSATSLGTQFQRDVLRGTFAFGAGLLAGTRTLAGTATRFAVNEATSDNRTLGAFFQQQFGFRDRIFVTGAIRGDQNNAFGADFGFAAYPSLSASWVLSEEPFFPQVDAVSNLRLRAAYGRSGLRPGFRDAQQFYGLLPATILRTGPGGSSGTGGGTVGTDVPGFSLGGVGNPNLRPELSDEVELGLDADFFGERVGLEFTFYDKRSQDALVFRNLAPSLGVTAGRFENIGSVRNTGLEFTLNTRILDLPNAQWEVNLTGTRYRNELIELGRGIEPIRFGFGSTQRHQPGYPLGGYWSRPLLSYQDLNNDGRITRVNCPGAPAVAGGPACEIQLGDTAVFLGSSQPTREFGFSTNATLFRIARVTALLDYKGGYNQFNSTREFRCAQFLNCQDAYDPNTPLEQQAWLMARFQGSFDGYIEEASFVKLRELSLTLTAPETLSRRFGLGAEGLSLTFAGRNLRTWTDYTGFDPEVNAFGQANFAQADFLTQPPVRYYTARLNVNF
ncbi:MAG: SusC/RagA family TonB-linked outer membrane protein [Gemmatimonadota bacterium]|nr:SusC/RagA family TonB-linked outer membrane protein [Gemmatimonadota bacterium]